MRIGRAGNRRIVACLTILAIAGTISACGRYGRPKRPTAPPAESKLEFGFASDAALR